LTKEEEKTESLGIQEESRPSIDVRWVLNEYNAIAMAVGFPVAKVESASRARMISARLKEFPEAEWRAMFDALRKSTHLTKEKWFIGIDWICSSTQHFEKVRAGWMDWAQQIKGPSNRLSTENSGSLVQQLREQGKVTL
jgi:hypothetical protein